MKNINIDGYSFITEDLDTAKVVFSTAENDFNVNRSTYQGKENIENIKKWFELENVSYLSQCHSDLVHIYDGSIVEGDALITDKPGIAVGVFTADCVPVLIYDKSKNVVAAVHSGWKGTYSRIVTKTIEKMISVYGSKTENLNVYIGPHMRDCCYEVGTEVMEKFNKSGNYNNINIFKDKKLSMEKCILKELKDKNVPDKNIVTLELCTFCSNKPRLYSYRKGEKDKRLFSFIYFK